MILGLGKGLFKLRNTNSGENLHWQQLQHFIILKGNKMMLGQFNLVNP